jgi:hypothetical protein
MVLIFVILIVKEICNYYNYIPFPNLSHITGYIDTSFTNLLLQKKTY